MRTIPLLLAWTLAAVTLAGCGAAPTAGPAQSSPESFFAQATATAQAGEMPLATSSAPLGDPRETLIGAFLRLEKAYPNRQTIQGAAPNCDAFESIIEYESAEEYHTVFDGCGFKMESIVAGGQLYYSTIPDRWTKIPMLDPAFTSLVPATEDLMQESLKSASFVRPEEFNGVSTYVYEYVAEAENGEQVSGEAWIGVLDTLPYRTTASFVSDGKQVDLETLYEYPDSISVEPPAGVE